MRRLGRRLPLPRFPLEGERVRLEVSPAPGSKTGNADRQAGALIRSDGSALVGSFALELAPATLTIHALCIDEAHRGYGLGSEAARLFREAAEAGPWTTLRAWAPPDRGLAVYFWSRMGLRPLFGEGPEGGIWFERRVG